MPKKDRPRRDKLEEAAILARRARVAALYLGGVCSQERIADRLGVVKRTVETDLAAMKAEWLAERKLAFDEAMGKQIARLEWLIERATDEYERSRTPGVQRAVRRETVPAAPQGGVRKGQYPGDRHTVEGEVRRTAARGAPAPMVEVNVVVQERTVERLGDPRYLAEIRACTELLCKLFGLLKPPDQTVNNNVIVPVVDWAAVRGDPDPRPSREMDRVIERAALPATEGDR